MTRAIASFGWLPLVGLLLVSAAGAADQRAGRRPNVVLIVADDKA
jgi:hypothetical protein